MKRLLQLTLVLLITAGLTTVANAQGNIESRATVQSTISVTGEQALDFGTIAQGASSTVSVSDNATVGRFLVTGNGGTVDLDFDLSNATLTGPGADIPITFGAGSAAWGTGSSSPTYTFDPANVTDTGTESVNLYDSDIYVFIGGQITAAADQTAGDYTGEIILTASYN